MDPLKGITKAEIKEAIESKLSRYFNTTSADASESQIYKATVLTVKDILTSMRSEYKKDIKKSGSKRVVYLCMEFLLGRSLQVNLSNLGIVDEYRSALREMGFSLDHLYELEPDPSLGNGGLGRLAACFMDSLSTLGYPANGYSICYDYGFFRQKIVDGQQIELPDVWLPDGECWLVPRTDKTFTVRFDGHIIENWHDGRCDIIHENYTEVQAVPYDLMISGANSRAVNTLRLWRARGTNQNFNMKLFSQGEYIRAMQQNTSAEIISKVLYPSDEHTEGKLLRLTQQYFLVSASLQSVIADHLAAYGTLNNFADKVAIHINDTHPALCIPELMRILLDVYSYSWEDAWNIVTRTISYTNHTVMPEALESWNEDLFRLKLPRIYMIICEINRRLGEDLWRAYPGDWERISQMSIISYSQIRMANLSVVASHKVNGVSELHTQILKDTVFHNYYKYTPEKFINITNGIAHRRWLCCANPELASLLDETIGPDYRYDSERLSDFAKYSDDKNIHERLSEIKQHNKERFVKYYYNKTGIALDTHSIFDVHVKRIHEYKRQLLGALKIIAYYNELKENPNSSLPPHTFIFGGKAAPGYYIAKDIINLICGISEELEHDPRLRERMRVIFIEDYKVSTAEILMPASDISEQISLAGKEASGTGCMKFMINGALTVGTLDGANVEMQRAVGNDNIYIFGLRADEVEEIWRRGYESIAYYNRSERLRRAVDALTTGFNGKQYTNIMHYLLLGHGVADPYMCLADFDSYTSTCRKAAADYENKSLWYKKVVMNIAGAGYFSSDRSIREYAEKIWGCKSIYGK